MKGEGNETVKGQEMKKKKGFWKSFTDGISEVIGFILEIFSKQ